MRCQRTENDVHDGRDAGRESVHTPTEKRLLSVDLQPLLRAAIEESGMQFKYVAACMGISGPQLNEMLAGSRPLTLERIELAPLEVQQPFARRYAEAMAFTVTVTCPLAEALAVQQAATARVQMLLGTRSLTERTRMARMDLEPDTTKVKTA